MDSNNSSGMMNGIPKAPVEQKKIGPVIGILAVVIILIVSALYIFGTKLNTKPAVNVEPVVQETNTTNTASVSSSIDNSAIQADLDSQLKDIDYSF